MKDTKPKPPKPSDRPAQPRFKGKKRGNAPQFPPYNRPMQLLNSMEILHEIENSNNRTTAIVGAGLIENNLAIAILCRFRELTDGQQKELCDKENSALGTFSRKIQIGFAMGLFEQRVKDDLNAIRRIRNAFAHRIEVRSFDHDEVRADCDKLFGPRYLAWAENRIISIERKERYVQTAAHLATRFDLEGKVLKRPDSPKWVSYETFEPP